MATAAAANHPSRMKDRFLIIIQIAKAQKLSNKTLFDCEIYENHFLSRKSLFSSAIEPQFVAVFANAF